MFSIIGSIRRTYESDGLASLGRLASLRGFKDVLLLVLDCYCVVVLLSFTAALRPPSAPPENHDPGMRTLVDRSTCCWPGYCLKRRPTIVLRGDVVTFFLGAMARDWEARDCALAAPLFQHHGHRFGLKGARTAVIREWRTRCRIPKLGDICPDI